MKFAHDKPSILVLVCFLVVLKVDRWKIKENWL